MLYPNSPFDEHFDTRVITNLKEDNDQKSMISLERTLKWLCSAPKLTSYRINTLKIEKTVAANRIQQQLDDLLGPGVITVIVDALPDVVLVKHLSVDANSLEKYVNEVIVDVDCAAAVLRGAHIYAPGVLGMISGTQEGDKVSIYADLSKQCKKGVSKKYIDGNKVFIGNGIVKMARKDLFGEKLLPVGVAVKVFETLSGCPSLGEFLPTGWALLQNLPSILCVYALNPNRNDIVLDMCAAPGNKTTHIAALMQNKGTIIAIDKLSKKVEQLKTACKDFGARVAVFQADSCNIVDHTVSNVEQGPPFSPETFDKILLDAPCSVLGKRPQFFNKTSEKVIRSYVPLQRKLFTSAVALLKPKGKLVYSTCTITLAENEGMVAWALKTFECLELVKPEMCFGEPGWPGTSLFVEERLKLQRFGPDQTFDSVGFFLACFVKR